MYKRQVYGDAQVYGEAAINGGKWETSPIHIQVEPFSLTNSRPGYIKIGCCCESFAWWKSEEARKLALKNGFNEELIALYSRLIDTIIACGK